MVLTAIVVNNPQTNKEQSAADALDPDSQARSKGQRVSRDNAKSTESGEHLPWLRKAHSPRQAVLFEVCCDGYSRTLRSGTQSSAAPRVSRKTFGHATDTQASH